jgi:hypothetical protein
MSEPVWADRGDGGHIPFDLEQCVRFWLGFDLGFGRISGTDFYLYLHRTQDGDLWIYAAEWFDYDHSGERIPGRSCCIVTKEKARQLCLKFGQDVPDELGEAGPAGPTWHRESKTLRYGDTDVRTFKKWAENQIKILDALQAAGWPRKSIANPLHNEFQLRQTIKDFNESLKKTGKFPLFHLVQDHDRVGWVSEQGPDDLP